ncbi:unnamed protein product [Gadus morhua 'NCC']
METRLAEGASGTTRSAEEARRCCGRRCHAWYAPRRAESVRRGGDLTSGITREVRRSLDHRRLRGHGSERHCRISTQGGILLDGR